MTSASPQGMVVTRLLMYWELSILVTQSCLIFDFGFWQTPESLKASLVNLQLVPYGLHRNVGFSKLNGHFIDLIANQLSSLTHDAG
jgi:hypothetical protein